jgi:hypothetical protein
MRAYGIYNLAMGDLNQEGQIDDHVVSDNGDRNKILAKVMEFLVRRKPFSQ